MIPLLQDRSPVRAYQNFELEEAFGALPNVIRVCDIALITIEKKTNCTFFYNTYSNKLFNAVTNSHRLQVKQQIEKWWIENKNKSFTAGLQDQIDYTERHWWNLNYQKSKMTNTEVLENRHADKYNGHYALLNMYIQMIKHGDNKDSKIKAYKQLKSFSKYSQKDFAEYANYYLNRMMDLD